MSEKWKTEFFEWKDEIEAKFNNLSQKNTELENKFEKMLYIEDIKKMKETIGKLKDFPNLQEQIDDLHKQVNNNATEVDTRFSISERVLRDVGHSLIATHEVLNLPMLEEENKFLRENLEKLKYYPLHSWRIDPRLLDPDDEVVLDKITGVISIVKNSGKKEECLLKKPHASAVSVERKLIEKCQCPIHKDSRGEKSVCDGSGTLGANKGGSVTDSKPPEPVDDKGFVTGNILPKGVELYELYLKDKEQYYFKKIAHPFTELNNMVHLGIGEVVATREDLKELLEMYHEGYGSDQPAVVEFLERIKEAWGV